MDYQYDPGDPLRAGDLPRQRAGANLVLVRVVSLRALPRRSLGHAFAGVVESVGENVTAFKPGDAVFGVCDDAFAGYVCAPQDDIAIKPDSLSFDQAAAAVIVDYTP